MAWKFPTSVSGSGTQIDLGDGVDDLYVAAQAFVATTSDTAVVGTGSNHDVRVYGSVASVSVGVFLGDAETDSGNRILIGAGGRIDSINSAAAALKGTDCDIINHGSLTGYYGAFFEVYGAAAVESQLENTGTIEDSAIGVFHGGTGKLIVSNSGLISASSYAYYANNVAVDTIANTGTMIGEVVLGSGADIFDSRSGSVTGLIDGGLDADKLYLGAGANTLSGGDGNDILGGGAGADALDGGAGSDAATYFYASSAVTVSLTKPSANKGDAAGDTFVSIENINGSKFNDFLYGDSGANKIGGDSGNDTIKGNAGKDTITGGSGHDVFIFDTALNKTTNVDKITDFSAANDTIHLENSIFTALSSTGALSSAAFRANGTGIAADSTDRIMYETDTGKLFYDRDGSGSSYDGVLFATLTNKQTITSADFVVI